MNVEHVYVYKVIYSYMLNIYLFIYLWENIFSSAFHYAKNHRFGIENSCDYVLNLIMW
jgi:hypothetical protein